MSENAASKPKNPLPWWGWTILGALLIAMFVAVAVSEPNDAPDPASTAVETTSFANFEEMEEAIESEFGGLTNMDLSRDLSVEFEEKAGWLKVSYVLDENLSGEMTRLGAWKDIHRIFELARMGDFVNELTINTMFPLINNLGEELAPQDVVFAYFDPDVYQRINLDNLTGENLSGAASAVVIHPAFQK